MARSPLPLAALLALGLAACGHAQRAPLGAPGPAEPPPSAEGPDAAAGTAPPFVEPPPSAPAPARTTEAGVAPASEPPAEAPAADSPPAEAAAQGDARADPVPVEERARDAAGVEAGGVAVDAGGEAVEEGVAAGSDGARPASEPRPPPRNTASHAFARGALKGAGTLVLIVATLCVSGGELMLAVCGLAMPTIWPYLLGATAVAALVGGASAAARASPGAPGERVPPLPEATEGGEVDVEAAVPAGASPVELDSGSSPASQ
jgi:hypothetical protein